MAAAAIRKLIEIQKRMPNPRRKMLSNRKVMFISFWSTKKPIQQQIIWNLQFSSFFHWLWWRPWLPYVTPGFVQELLDRPRLYDASACGGGFGVDQQHPAMNEIWIRGINEKGSGNWARTIMDCSR
jgi:hypothetical protein